MSNKFKYKILSALTGLSVAFLFNNMTVHAEGGINSNEQRVLISAQGTFEYNGEVYTAKQEYVDQLYQYLAGEDVNLTSEQADKAINTMYSNIENGVTQGYIVKLQSSEDNLNRDEKFEITEVSPEEKDKEKNDNKDKETGPSIKENDEGELTVTDKNGEDIYVDKGILKNTGFSIRKTMISLIIVGVIFIWVVISTVRLIWVEKRR